MSLETTLTDITTRLRQGRYPNEQAISQGIVLRVLQEMGWDAWDPTFVWPEYQTGEGRADFALCHPPSKPAIFIEVKQPGKAEDAVRQALEYAFHTGVPFIVLTDGRTWSFYLPAEQGSYEAEPHNREARRHDDVFVATLVESMTEFFVLWQRLWISQGHGQGISVVLCPIYFGKRDGGNMKENDTDEC